MDNFLIIYLHIVTVLALCLFIFAEEYDNISLDAKQMSETADTDMKSQTGAKSKNETASENTSVSKETWITFEEFCVCFQ